MSNGVQPICDVKFQERVETKLAEMEKKLRRIKDALETMNNMLVNITNTLTRMR